VSAGGLSPGGSRWVPTQGKYLFPVKVLARLFRGKLRAALIDGLASGAIELPPDSAPDVLDQLRVVLYRTDWVVYAKAPFGGAEQVYAYRRPVHPSRRDLQRAPACGGRRGRDLRDEEGEASSRSRASSSYAASWTTCGPAGFTRIRHDGLLAPCHATTTLERARALLTPPTPVAPTTEPSHTTPGGAPSPPPTWVERLQALTGVDAGQCSRCAVGRLMRRPLDEASPTSGWDTS